MAFFQPIEAIAKRVNEIPVSNGNFIINTTDGQIMYDTYDNKRITISGVTFINTEEELLSSTGINNRLYIVKNTGGIYYWLGNWCSCNTDSKKIKENAKAIEELVKTTSDHDELLDLICDSIGINKVY